MIACIDIGGGTTRTAVSTDAKSFSEVKKFDTPQEFKDLTEKIADSLVAHTESIKQVSIGMPGTVDRKENSIRWWGQRSWNGQSFVKSLGGIFPNAKFFLENDADIAALGEAIYGAGKGYSLVGYITLSSGIGGGLIIDGKIAPYKVGFEPGHQIIKFDETEVWSCGQRGCFESYASGTAFKKIFGMPAEDCNDPKIWEKYAKYLAVGVGNTAAFWSSEVIVLGGGVSNSFGKFIEPLERELKRIMPFEMPEIRQKELDEPGLYGGLAL